MLHVIDRLSRQRCGQLKQVAWLVREAMTASCSGGAAQTSSGHLQLAIQLDTVLQVGLSVACSHGIILHDNYITT